MNAVAWLTDGDAITRQRCGGKAASLARLYAASFEVPPGYVVTVEAVSRRDADGAWPDGLRSTILEAYRELAPDGGAVAVRSSGVAEDSEQASFAGQHETILDVRGEEALFDAIDVCIASLHSEAAVAYRQRAGLRDEDAAMAVVVQRMVPATAAGVAFSVDPAGGSDGIVVEAVTGTGEALVSGQAEPERFLFERETLALVEHSGTGPVLDEEQARAAAQAALQAEDAFGGPQDIEFAFEEEQLWMLQSRPITVVQAQVAGWVSEFDTPTTDDLEWTSANVQEVLPGMLTPLSMSLSTEMARLGYVGGYRGLKLIGKEEEPTFFGFFYNRAFLNIDTMRLVADRAPAGSADSVEARYLGGEAKPGGIREKPLRRVGFQLRSTVPLFRLMFTMQKQADRLSRETLALERRVRDMGVKALSDEDLDRELSKATAFASGVIGLHLQVSGFASSGYELVVILLKPVLGDETEARVPPLFSGMRDVESARIGLDLWDLSRVAINVGIAGEVGEAGFDPWAMDLPSGWRAAFRTFMERHGHRGVNELEASAVTWRRDPAPVVRVVVSYLDLADDQSPPAMLARQEEERQALTEELAGRMNPVKRRVFRKVLRDAQSWVTLRERTKSITVRAARIGDYLTPEAAERLVGKGAVARADDVFFLTREEISDALRGTGADFGERVMRRRRELERNRHVLLPDRFKGRPEPIPPDTSAHGGEVLTGIGVSRGVATGRARIILDPATDGPLLPGEILVAPVTDAGWTPLFALASGLVVDMGSALSHGSTVAREYGLPAVVNARRATQIIHTGDLVTVDGSAGTVAILAASKGEEWAVDAGQL